MKMKKKYYWIAGVVAVLLAGVGLWFYMSDQADEEPELMLELRDGAYFFVTSSDLSGTEHLKQDGYYKIKIYSEGQFMSAMWDSASNEHMVLAGNFAWNLKDTTMVERPQFVDTTWQKMDSNSFKMVEFQGEGFKQMKGPKETREYDYEEYLNPETTKSGLDGLWVSENSNGSEVDYVLMVGGGHFIIATAGKKGEYGVAKMSSYQGENYLWTWPSEYAVELPTLSFDGKSPVYKREGQEVVFTRKD